MVPDVARSIPKYAARRPRTTAREDMADDEATTVRMDNKISLVVHADNEVTWRA